MPAMSNMAERKLQGSQKPIVLPEGGAINDVQARAIYTDGLLVRHSASSQEQAKKWQISCDSPRTCHIGASGAMGRSGEACERSGRYVNGLTSPLTFAADSLHMFVVSVHLVKS